MRWPREPHERAGVRSERRGRRIVRMLGECIVRREEEAVAEGVKRLMAG